MAASPAWLRLREGLRRAGIAPGRKAYVATFLRDAEPLEYVLEAPSMEAAVAEFSRTLGPDYTVRPYGTCQDEDPPRGWVEVEEFPLLEVRP